MDGWVAHNQSISVHTEITVKTWLQEPLFPKFPIQQDKPEEPNKELVTDVMGFDPKFDGLKMKNKTMPCSKVAKGAVMGTLGAATVIVPGKDILSNAMSICGAGIGYQLAGEEGV